MNEATQDYIRPGYEAQPIPGFPHAPLDWSREDAEGVARSEGMTLTDEQAHFLAQVSPYVANAASADAEDATGGPSHGWARAGGAGGLGAGGGGGPAVGRVV